MISELTRRCRVCGDLYELGAGCAKCGSATCPPVSEWPKAARRFLYLLTIADALWSKLDREENEQLRWLLENAMRGRYYDGRLLAHAATAAECYPEFLTLLAKWEAAGSPTDVAAIAKIRGMRRN